MCDHPLWKIKKYSSENKLIWCLVDRRNSFNGIQETRGVDCRVSIKLRFDRRIKHQKLLAFNKTVFDHRFNILQVCLVISLIKPGYKGRNGKSRYCLREL